MTDTYISDEMVGALANALEPYSHSLQLVRLVDGVSTYRAEVGDEAKEFELTDDAYEWIGEKKRELQARDVFRAIAPMLIREGMEKAAEIAEEYAYGPARAGDIAAQVADAIRTAKEEV